MRSTMADEKKTCNDTPTFVITTAEASPATASSKRFSNRKLAIIVISVVVLVAIVLTAILIGMNMFTASQKDIIKYTQQLDKNTVEEVESNPSSNIVKYHTRNNNYDMWVIDDFNRDIEVVKMKTDNSVRCYASPLNPDTANDPSKIAIPQNLNQLVSNITEKIVYYDLSKSPIRDTSYLSKAARDLCKGTPIYWTIPNCDPNKTSESSGRSKRRVCCGVRCTCCPIRCRWGCYFC